MRRAAAPPEGVLGSQDETWWSRLAAAPRHAWTAADQPLRLVAQTVSPAAPAPKALACYGLVRAATGQMRVRFVTGRPVSPVTEASLAWVWVWLAAEGKQMLLLVWDHAPWHGSKRERA
jgi:hypothetical protein